MGCTDPIYLEWVMGYPKGRVGGKHVWGVVLADSTECTIGSRAGVNVEVSGQ